MQAGGYKNYTWWRRRVAARDFGEPLPQRQVSPVEEAVWFSDRPADPRVVVLVAQLARPVDHQLLIAALKVVTGRDDLLLSHPSCKSRFGRRFVWSAVDGADQQPAILTASDDAPLSTLIERLRLSVERIRPGIAVGVARQGGGDVLVLVIHHMLTDGLGAVDLLSEILVLAGLAADVPPVKVESAPGQTDAVATLAASVHRRLPIAPGRVAPEVRPVRVASKGFGYVSASLLPARPPAYATVNDVLIAATMLAVQRWNTEHGQATGRIAVHMPISARVIGHEPGEMRNATGQVLVKTNQLEREPSRLLANVAGQTRPAKSAPESHTCAADRAVTACMWLPARIRKALLSRIGAATSKVLMPTVTVSNLGRLDAVFPNLPGASSDVEKLLFFTTAGMPQGITVTATGLHGRLHLALTYSRRLLSDRAADAFLESVVDAMRQVVEDAAPARVLVAASN